MTTGRWQSRYRLLPVSQRVFTCLIQEDEGDYTYVERIQVPLSHGSLLLMSGSTQDDWQVSPTRQTQADLPVLQFQLTKNDYLCFIQHQVAKEYHDRGPRINLTFRTIHPEPEGHRAGTKLRFTVQQS